MKFKRIELFLFGVMCVLIGGSDISHASGSPAEGGDPADGYPREFHDQAYNIVVGKITAVTYPTEKDSFFHFRLALLGDMHSSLKVGSTISILGPDNPVTGYSGNQPSVLLVRGSTAVFLIRNPIKAGPDQFDFAPVREFPFGVDSYDTAIPAEDAHLLFTALTELEANLHAKDGLGMSKERARILLNDKNPYLWAMACTRLARDADLDDLNLMKHQFRVEGMTAWQLLFLDELLERVTGPADGSKPTYDERVGELRLILKKYAKAGIVPPPAPHDETN